jgi:hypothetical protein
MALTLTTDTLAELQSLVTSCWIPHGLGTRARMIILSHDRFKQCRDRAQKLGVTNGTVWANDGSGLSPIRFA